MLIIFWFRWMKVLVFGSAFVNERVCLVTTVWDGAHPKLWPKRCCFAPRLWPIDCLPRKNEFRMRKKQGFKGKYSMKLQLWTAATSLHLSLLSISTVSVASYVYVNWISFVWNFHWKPQCFYLCMPHISLDCTLWTRWPPGKKDVVVTSHPNC